MNNEIESYVGELKELRDKVAKLEEENRKLIAFLQEFQKDSYNEISLFNMD